MTAYTKVFNMTIKSSGRIGMTDISNEFTGTNPLALNAYYRGGSKVADGPTPNALIPKSGIIGLKDFYGSRKPYDSGLITVSSQGITDYKPTTPLTNFVIKHYGAWGQSNEKGSIRFLNSAAVEIMTLLEQGTALIPTGFKLYSVTKAGVEAVLSALPHQTSSLHYVYVQIIGVPNISTIRSKGAPGASDNPTSFRNMQITDGLSREAILAAMGTIDTYYIIKP